MLPALTAPRSDKGVASGAWEVPPSLEPSDEPKAKMEVRDRSQGDGALILVVEDNGINRTVALSQLESPGATKPRRRSTAGRPWSAWRRPPTLQY